MLQRQQRPVAETMCSAFLSEAHLTLLPGSLHGLWGLGSALALRSAGWQVGSLTSAESAALPPRPRLEMRAAAPECQPEPGAGCRARLGRACTRFVHFVQVGHPVGTGRAGDGDGVTSVLWHYLVRAAL